MINAQKLHYEFVRLGGARLKLKNKMLAMLPEIYESGIWEKYAGSIEEYAGKYGDIAKTTVIKRIRLEENLKDKPCLKAAISKVGVHKVALLAKIATSDTDSVMAENVVNMSKMAVQSLSKELRAGQSGKNAHGSADHGFVHHAPLCKAVSITKKIELDENSAFLFMKLKSKLGKNLSDKEFLEILLEERAKQEFSQKQSRFLTKNDKNVTDDTNTANTAKSTVANGSAASRYIPADKKRKVIAQTQGKCTYPNCNVPFQVFHHVDRYSESRSHDSIIPLCKIHHEFAHHNLIRDEALKADEWRISVLKTPEEKISQEDVLYRKYRGTTRLLLKKRGEGHSMARVW